MKTTIELPDDLLEKSKAVARRENSTLEALVEEGLRLALRSRSRRRAAPKCLCAESEWLGDQADPGDARQQYTAKALATVRLLPDRVAVVPPGRPGP